MSAVAAQTCTKCAVNKPFAEFQVNARYASGYTSWCKCCSAEYRKAHYRRNFDKTKERNAAWHLANKERRNADMRAAYAADPAGHSARARAAKDRRPEYYREAAKLNARKRRAERVDVRLRSRVSSQFRYCLSTGKGGRTTESLLGYTIAELRTHLERQFLKGMGWENMGEWHIDHITPLSSFVITGADDPELRRAWALPNLRPLWAIDNMSKGAKLETLL